MTDYLKLARDAADSYFIEFAVGNGSVQMNLCAQLAIATELRRIADALEKMASDEEAPAWGRND